MDNGLKRVDGLRVPAPLLFEDLPTLAWSLTAVLRNKGYSQVLQQDGQFLVRLVAPSGPNITVRGVDWEKILPYLASGSFSVSQAPIKRPYKEFNNLNLEIPATVTGDPLYPHILSKLQQLFPPT